MEAHEVHKDRWSFKLAPQLTGKAQQAYAALSPEDEDSNPTEIQHQRGDLLTVVLQAEA